MSDSSHSSSPSPSQNSTNNSSSSSHSSSSSSDCGSSTTSSHKINSRQLYNLLARTQGDSVPLALVIDLRPVEEYHKCHVRNAINIFITEDYDGPINQRLLETGCRDEELPRFKFRGIFTIVVYGGSIAHRERMTNFFIEERKARDVRYLGESLEEFFEVYPFRCNGTRAPRDSHDIYPSQISDILFLGGQHSAQSKEQIKNLKIHHVLNCASEELPNYFENNTEIKYHTVPIEDDPNAELKPYIHKAVNFIEHAKTKNEPILVHCRAGKSRSATFVVAYLIIKEHMTFDQAYGHVKECRPNIDINLGFIQQLKTLSQKQLHDNETDKTHEKSN